MENEQSETTALTSEPLGSIQTAVKGMNLQSVDDMWRAAQMFSGSGLCPNGLDSPNKVIVALQAGAELGLLPWQSLQSLYVVNGRVGLSGSTMVGLIRRSKECEYFDMGFEGEPFKDTFRAIVKSKRRDEPIEHITDFSVDDAKRANIWEGKDKTKPHLSPWVKYPKDMLTWRAVSRHARLYYADVITGFYTEGEIQDMVPTVPLMDAATAPGVQGLVKRIDAQTKAAEPETPSGPLDRSKPIAVCNPPIPGSVPLPNEPAKKGRKPKLVDWFCPACGKDYQYGAQAGKGVACECGKSNIRRKPDAKEPDPAKVDEAEKPTPQEAPKAPSQEVPKEQAPPPEQPKYKCTRCEKVMTERTDNGTCTGCFGEVTMLAPKE